MLTKIPKYLLTHIRNVSSLIKIGVLGVPFEKGQTKIGVGNGPKILRDHGLIESLKEISNNIDVVDYGDVSYTPDSTIKEVPNMKQYVHLVPCVREASKCVSQIIQTGRICLTLGGDHAIGLATVDGHIKAKSSDIILFWVDAHADINTNKTSSSGNTHGMPVALLVKELSNYWPHLPGMDWQKPEISVKNIVYIGLRSVDNYEKFIMKRLGILAFGMKEIQIMGIEDVVQTALKQLDPEAKKSIHVSFDIDSLDALEAPSTGTPVRGGLTLREGIHIMEAVHRTGRLGAMDMVEVNPSLGNERDVDTTVTAAIHIITAAFGFNRKGIKPFNVHDIPK
ncbi:hypothetical protein FQA39_LY15594 [Lamprigera yunnana]|nr:hypothetical protein FQA39_LY15594 [Lamprigera yunnana]